MTEPPPPWADPTWPTPPTTRRERRQGQRRTTPDRRVPAPETIPPERMERLADAVRAAAAEQKQHDRRVRRGRELAAVVRDAAVWLAALGAVVALLLLAAVGGLVLLEQRGVL